MEIDKYPYFKDIPFDSHKDSLYIAVSGYLLDGDINELTIESDNMLVSKYGTGKSKFGKKTGQRK